MLNDHTTYFSFYHLLCTSSRILGCALHIVRRAQHRSTFRTVMLTIALSVFLLIMGVPVYGQEGTKTTPPPLPSYTNAVRYFSPNLDGTKDVMTIPIVITERGNLVAWSVTIYQKIGTTFKTLQTFSDISELERETVSFKQSLSRLFRRERGITPPPYVEWNGAAKNGTPMPDGVYYVSYYARDGNDNETTTPLYPIVIDTITPEATLVLSNKVFSPNEDGNKETLAITLTPKIPNPLDTAMIVILDSNEKPIRTYKTPLTKNIEPIVWDGLTANNKKAPEGTYTLHLTLSDLAGNTFADKNNRVTLVRTFETVDFSLSLPAISPNGDGFFDSLTLDTRLSSQVGLATWNIDITAAKSKNPVVTYSGTTNLKTSILFSGKDKSGTTLPDGRYSVGFNATFNSGNTVTSQPLPLIIDTTPPTLKARLREKVFNPKSAQETTRQLHITQTAVGNPTDTYDGAIIDENDEEIYTFPQTQGTVKANLTWDGRNNNQETNSGLYRYKLTGQDALSNTAVVITSNTELISERVNVRIRSTHKAFSPNNDNIKETTEFQLAITETYRRLIKNGSIEIAQKNKQRVAAIEFDNYTNKFTWNGANNKGKTLKDGQYFYRANVNFSTGEKIVTTYKSLYLDTVAPNVTSRLHTPVFSPNGDGTLDAFHVSHNHTPSMILPAEDRFTVQIKTATGTIVREKEWNEKLPQDIKWTGNTDINQTAPEGKYTYTLSAEDAAGNVMPPQTLSFDLVRSMPQLTLEHDPSLISFHPEANKTAMTLTPLLSDNKYFNNIAFVLAGGEKNRVIATQAALTPYKWDARTYKSPPATSRKKSTRLPPFKSGPYNLTAKAKFTSGITAASTPKPIFIDNIKPKVTLKHDPAYFSPDNDNTNETLRLRVTAKDNHQIVKTDISIFRRIQFDKTGKPFPQTLAAYKDYSPPFKKYSWSSAVDEVIRWDGVGDNGNIVESANDYIVFLEAEDAVGLRSITRDTIRVDIFVERLADGRLRIVINSINFKYDSSKMVGDYDSILKRLAVMLSRFPDYRIDILGHTDSRGTEPYNQSLSERRARAVFNVLTLRGVPKRIMKYSGAGEKELFIKDEVISDASLSEAEQLFLTEENYRRNRRVEFYLERPTKNAKKSSLQGS
ncbi:hypothetical protein COTS27_01603 [Spirochaetota bacterium]|nr:hypothetical protein COTS27_01603 [Spirochaetota bacterium]